MVATNREIEITKRASLVRWLAATPVGELLDLKYPFSYRAMRFISRSNTLRSAAVRFRTSYRRNKPLPRSAETLFPVLSAASVVQRLRKDGYAAGISLPEPSLQAILKFSAQAEFIPDRSPDRRVTIDLSDESNPLPGNILFRCHNPHRQCPTVDQLVHDPFIVDVAKGYLENEPMLLSTQIWWSYPYISKNNADLYTPEYGFHYDIDDYRFLKLFIYLNDVDEERGPHVIIEGTHRKKNFFEKGHRRLTDSQAAARYQGRIRVMTGRAGEGFFEDTFCYHKGTNPRKRRLILQIQYGLSECRLKPS
jgi:hypothetical protein